jgi:hypothetical protein
MSSPANRLSASWVKRSTTGRFHHFGCEAAYSTRLGSMKSLHDCNQKNGQTDGANRFLVDRSRVFSQRAPEAIVEVHAVPAPLLIINCRAQGRRG